MGVWWYLVINFTLKGIGGSIKKRTYAKKGKGGHFKAYLVHKVLTTITRFFASFTKIPVWLKISLLNKPCFSFLKNYIETNQVCYEERAIISFHISWTIFIRKFFCMFFLFFSKLTFSVSVSLTSSCSRPTLILFKTWTMNHLRILLVTSSKFESNLVT